MFNFFSKTTTTENSNPEEKVQSVDNVDQLQLRTVENGNGIIELHRQLRELSKRINSISSITQNRTCELNDKIMKLNSNLDLVVDNLEMEEKTKDEKVRQIDILEQKLDMLGKLTYSDHKRMENLESRVTKLEGLFENTEQTHKDIFKRKINELDLKLEQVSKKLKCESSDSSSSDSE
jgi:hypothetical protein